MRFVSIVICLLLFIQTTVFAQSCLPEGIIFSTQEQIDGFQTNHPGCTIIEGNVEVSGDDITNLYGLYVLTEIRGYLWIVASSSLSNITGLDNVISIEGDLVIEGNYALTSLTGLDNVTSIEEEVVIALNPCLSSLTGLDNLTYIGGMLGIGYNNVLIDLKGLDNLTSIEGYLDIIDNISLISLTGIESINSVSIERLLIKGNTSLSTCEVKSICDYLISPTGSINIHDNAPGCNSQEEVEEACTVSMREYNYDNNILIFPNPVNREITISCNPGNSIEKIIIYNQTGQIVLHQQLTNKTINISHLHPGMYFIEVVSDQKRIREKLMIQ